MLGDGVLKKVFLVLLCFMFLMTSCRKTEESGNENEAVPRAASRSRIEIESETKPRGEFIRNGEKVTLKEKQVGTYSLVSGLRNAPLLFDVEVGESSVRFLLLEDGLKRDLSTIPLLPSRYDVRVTTENGFHTHTGFLVTGSDGRRNVVSVDEVDNDFLSSDRVCITISNEFASYDLGWLDTSHIDNLRYETDGYGAMLEKAETYLRKAMYRDASSTLREYRDAYPVTFENFGGDELLQRTEGILYDMAVLKYREGKYEECLECISGLDGDYRDSVLMKANAEAALNGKLRPGDTIAYGRNSRGEKIEWNVVALEDGKILLISRDILFRKPYNAESASPSWEKSTLRKFLNSEGEKGFLSSFSSEELQKIVETRVYKTENSYFGVSGGADTTDRVFLLSASEVEQFYPHAMDRMQKYDGSASSWWLRSPGDSTSTVSYVTSTGLIHSLGDNVRRDCGVRPVMWIDADAASDAL